MRDQVGPQVSATSYETGVGSDWEEPESGAGINWLVTE